MFNATQPIMQTPLDGLAPAAGQVLAVHAGTRHAFSKQTSAHISLIEGFGVAGDVHGGATVKHRSRVAKDATQPNLRQVHFLQSELFDELLGKGFKVRPGELGENISTRGIALLALPVGSELHLGDAVVKLTGLRNPCYQLDQFQRGLMAAVLDHTPAGELVRKAGVMAVVLRGGMVRAGDAISVVLPAAPHRPLAPV